MSSRPLRTRRVVLHFRRNRLLAIRLLVAALLFPSLLWLAVSSIAAHTSFGVPAKLLQPQPQNAKELSQKILLVTAHPDDESLWADHPAADAPQHPHKPTGALIR
jgi:hypothetical protein